MTPVYAVALVLGVIAILAWVTAVAIAESVDGWEHVDPERRFGASRRLGVAAFAGFGLGGMSATFAGWHPAVSFGAALAGAVIVGAVAHFAGPRADVPR